MGITSGEYPANDANTFRLLTDDPAENDDLGGGHKRTATAVVKLIDSNEGGKAIGLIGSWGGGKSTVVSFIKKTLEEDSRPDRNNKVFVFDAWSHDGDPLRRSFLERLAMFLKREKWAKEEQWKGDLTRLKGRHEETTRKATTGLSNESKWIGSTLALALPIGIAILNAQKFDLQWQAFVGLFFALTPLLVGCLYWIKHRKFPALITQTETTDTTTTRISPTPTSIEFEEIFNLMLRDVLTGGTNKDRRLIIVVDNLDRILDTEARAIWATMRTFFSFGREEWSERIWLIVPFDASAIERIWHIDAPNGLGSNVSPAEAFMDKFFYARFYVPGPVLSNWKQYLVDSLNKVLPTLSEEDVHNISRIFEVFKVANHPPTPREIKRFVNMLATQYQQWKSDGSITPTLQALFVAEVENLRTKGAKTRLFEKPLEELVAKIATLRQLNPRQWREALAAQYFNLDSNMALQVLLSDEITTLLQSADPAKTVRLLEYANTLGEAMTPLVISLLDENTKDWRGQSLAAAALAINKLQEELRTTDWRNAWRNLRDVMVAVQWDTLDETTVKGLRALLEAHANQQPEHIADHILDNINPMYPHDTGPESKEDVRGLEEWTKGLLSLIGVFEELGLMHVLQHKQMPVGNYKARTLVLANLDGSPLVHSHQHYFAPSDQEAKEVINHLISEITSTNISAYHTKAINALWELKPDQPDWSNYIAQTTSQLSNGNSSYSAEVTHSMVLSLVNLYRHQEAKNALQSLATTPVFLGHLYPVMTSGKREYISLIVFPILLYNPSGTLRSQPNNSLAGRNEYFTFLNSADSHQIELLAKLTYQTQSLGNLLQALSQADQITNLVRGILEAMVQNPEFIEAFEANYITYFNSLSSLLRQEDLAALTQHMLKRTPLARDVAQAPFDIDQAGMYVAILDGSNPPADLPEFNTFLQKGITQIPNAKWQELIQQKHPTLKLLAVLRERLYNLNLSIELSEALEEIAARSLRGLTSNLDQETLRILTYHLEPSTRSATAARIFHVLKNSWDEPIEPLINTFGGFLLEHSDLADLRHVLTVALPRILDRFSDVKLKWLSQLISKHKTQLPDVKDIIPQAIEYLKRASTTGSENPNGDLTTMLETLNEVLQDER